MATLEVLDGPNKGAVSELRQDEAVIGRLPYCDVILPQGNISRQHARIVRSGGKYFVEDLGSTNGTFVNGRRVRARTPLQDQDVVRVYTVGMLFRDDTPAELAATAKPPAEADARLQTFLPRSSGPAPQNVGVNAYEKLRTVLEITRGLGRTLDVDKVLPKILDGLTKVFPQTDRAYILLPDEEGGPLNIKAERHKEEGTMATSRLGPISQSIANRVMSQGEAILSADGLQPELDMGDSVLDFPIRSMMCAPLIGPMQKPVGIIYVDTNRPHERFHEDDLEVLLSVAATAGQAVEYAHAHAAQLRLDRRERELGMAQQVQRHFLPQHRPAVSGYRFFDYYSAAEEVSGDYYGYLTLPDGRLAIMLGDVAGKGVSAALVMARLCSDVRYRLVTTASVGTAVAALNRDFNLQEREAMFITFVVCVLDPARHDLTIVNAGHRPPLCRHAGANQLEELGADCSGTPLGCAIGTKYAEFVAKFEPGDSLLLYTDGIDEAMDAQLTPYGVPRLRTTVGAGPPTIDALCEWLLADVRRHMNGHPQSDDICLIGLQRLAP